MTTSLRLLFLLLALSLSSFAGTAAPESGPENGGLKMRLLVTPTESPEGFDVHVDLVNVTNRPITLVADTRTGPLPSNISDYIELSTSIETYPPIVPWMGGVNERAEITAPPERTLSPGEVLSTKWRTKGRHLKNKVADPNVVQNPEFPTPGRYSVHASANIKTATGTVLLRSNEQLVSVGGSHTLPKHTYGKLSSFDAQARTGTLSLGSLHKAATGDVFIVRGGKRGSDWRMTVISVRPNFSLGSLEPVPLPVGAPPREPRLPEPGQDAVLLLPDRTL